MLFSYRFVDRIERSEVLDRVADKLAAVVRPLAARPVVGDALTGRWLGHSVHPALVAVPIGCWTGAVILDAMAPGSSAARRLIGAGVLGALPAASTGMADWIDTAGAERRVGTAHALANDVAVTAFALSWFRVVAVRRGSVSRCRGSVSAPLRPPVISAAISPTPAGSASTPRRSSPAPRGGRP